MAHGPDGEPAPTEYPAMYPAIEHEHSEHTGRVVRIAAAPALGGLLFGYDSAVINGAVLAVRDHFGIGEFPLGVAVAAALIGAAIGAVTAGRLADRVGRLAVMKLAAVLFLASAFGTGLAVDIWMFGAFR